MDRQVLIKGFLKIFVPLAVAGTVGTLIGVVLGLGAYHTFFYIVIPIMAGGVGEGAIPLSIGYSEILHQEQGVLFAQVLPPIMLGSLTAILLSGLLNWVGKKTPTPDRRRPATARCWRGTRGWRGESRSLYTRRERHCGRRRHRYRALPPWHGVLQAPRPARPRRDVVPGRSPSS